MNARATKFRRTQRGVTLTEVLISLLIFSFISTAAVYCLRLGVDARDQMDSASADMRDFQLARALLKEDLAQLVNRRVRDRFGAQQIAPFFGGDGLVGVQRRIGDGALLAAYVRGGWLNPNGAAPRSALQYVEIIFHEGEVLRRTRPFLDEADGAQIRERVLFRGIDEAYTEFSFTSAIGETDWATVWPFTGASFGPPAAMALVIQREGRPAERHLFWIGEFSQEVLSEPEES